VTDWITWLICSTDAAVRVTEAVWWPMPCATDWIVVAIWLVAGGLLG